MITNVQHPVTGRVVDGLEVILDHVGAGFSGNVSAGITSIGHFTSVRPHLHLSLRFNDELIDPLPRISSENLGYYFSEYVNLPREN